MNCDEAHTTLELLDLLFGTLRKECVLGAMNAIGISEDHVQSAFRALEVVKAQSPPVHFVPAAPPVAGAESKKRRRRRR